MGRKKSPVTRNKSIDRRYVDPTSVPSLLGNVSPSSLRGLAVAKQESTVMDTESSFDSLHLPNPPFQSLYRAMPIGGEKRERRQKNRRKRRSSGDDVAVSRREEEDDSSEEERQEEEQVEMVTISVAELEQWQQRMIFHVEDHFSNEQLKRIAEFGRVHGTIMQEAQQYVGNMEMQLRRQFEEQRVVLRTEAEEFVAKMAKENESLRQQVKDLKLQVEGLEKQVDTLEKENHARQEDKGASSKQDESRQETNEQSQHTHSPPNSQTQVLPGNGKSKGKVEDHAASNCQKVNDSDLGGLESFHRPLVIKQVTNNLIDHCCASAQTNPASHHNENQGKDQLEQQQQPYTPPQSTSGAVNQDDNSSQSPAPSGELHTAGRTACS